MKQIILLITAALFISCGKDKVVLLPEINQSDITEINDVSAAYLFYDETKPDSTELNRKNLISTTNWLVNVDKRLTLKQAIPYIQFLQSKKLSSSHKNEKAKNYFTCNDISKKNLGFIEFTTIKYEIISSKLSQYLIEPLKTKEDYILDASYHANSTLSIMIDKDKNITFDNEIVSINQFRDKIDFVKEYNFIGISIQCFFNQNLSFQDYISVKLELNSLFTETISAGFKEYILN